MARLLTATEPMPADKRRHQIAVRAAQRTGEVHVLHALNVAQRTIPRLHSYECSQGTTAATADEALG